MHALKCTYVQSLYPRAKRSVTAVSGTNSRHTDTMTHTTCTVSTKNENKNIPQRRRKTAPTP